VLEQIDRVLEEQLDRPGLEDCVFKREVMIGEFDSKRVRVIVLTLVVANVLLLHLVGCLAVLDKGHFELVVSLADQVADLAGVAVVRHYVQVKGLCCVEDWRWKVLG